MHGISGSVKYDLHIANEQESYFDQKGVTETQVKINPQLRLREIAYVSLRQTFKSALELTDRLICRHLPEAT